jgi:hypothetical protein
MGLLLSAPLPGCAQPPASLLTPTQNQLKAKGFPWTLSKSFIAATPVGQPFELHPPGQPPVNIQGLTLVLKVRCLVFFCWGFFLGGEGGHFWV